MDQLTSSRQEGARDGVKDSNRLLLGLLYVLAFWGFFQLSFLFDVAPSVSAFYPATGATVAAMMLLGPRFLPLTVVAVILGGHPQFPAWEIGTFDVWMILRQGLVYGTAGLVLRGLAVNAPFRTTRDVTVFLIVAVSSTCLSALAAVANFKAYAVFPDDMLPEIFFSFWAGDASGLIMATPLLLVAATRLTAKGAAGDQPAWRRGRRRDLAVFLIVSAAVSAVGFAVASLSLAWSNVAYVIVVPVVWLAARTGIAGGSLVAVSANLSGALVYIAVGGQSQAAVELQALFALTASIGLIVGSAFEELRTSEAERRKKEHEVARMSRVAAVGELEATISHEIATPLQSAMINSRLMAEHLDRREAEGLEKLRYLNDQISAALEKAATIHKQIPRMLRCEERPQEELRLVDVVAAAIELVDADIRQSGVDLRVTTDGKDHWIRGNPMEIQQVMINLIKNAQQAIGEADGPRKRISVDLQSVPDGFVEIGVEDTGPGLTQEASDKVFESFYSTKANGLGLGLSICRRIVEGYGGSIWAANAGQGARFIVQLPELGPGHDR